MNDGRSGDGEGAGDAVQRLHQRKRGGGVKPRGGLVCSGHKGGGEAGQAGKHWLALGPGAARCRSTTLSPPRLTEEEQRGVRHKLNAHVHALALPAAA